MRKLLLLLVYVTCACSQQKYGQEGQHVVDYVSDNIKVTGFEAKNISIESVDTLLSDDRIDFGMTEFESTYYKYMNGEMTTKAYRNFLDSVIRHTYDIEFAWMSKEKNDSMRGLDKYIGAFRKVYTVNVVTDSKTQPTMTLRVLCEQDGKPRMFESLFMLEIQRFRERAESIYMAL